VEGEKSRGKKMEGTKKGFLAHDEQLKTGGGMTILSF